MYVCVCITVCTDSLLFIVSTIRFAYCGRLVGHNGGLCALACKDGTMVTGSRDRLIKVSMCLMIYHVNNHNNYVAMVFSFSSMTLALLLWIPVLPYPRSAVSMYTHVHVRCI